MSRFIKNDDNTVTDTQTGLIWTQQTVARDVNHDPAEEAVTALGEEWRLPTIDELLTLVDRSRHSPSIDTDALPDTEPDWYWTSTSCAWNEAARWVVGFDYGLVDSDAHRGSYASVRAVRAAPAATPSEQKL